MAIFAKCVFFIKVKRLSIQKKIRLKACIEENGGAVNFTLNHECTHVLVDTADALSSRDLKNVQKYQLPVLCEDFIWKSVEKGKLVKIDAYKVNKPEDDNSDKRPDGHDAEDLSSSENKNATKKNGNNDSDFTEDSDSEVETLRFYNEDDEDIPFFPQDFEVAKYSVLEKVNSKENKDFVVVELQCSQERYEFPFQLYAHFSASNGTQNSKKCVAKTAEEIREKYENFIADLKSQDFLIRETFPPEAESLASTELQKLLLEEAIHSSTICQEVSDFVELIWAEAIGHLDNLLFESVNNISLNDVSKAEGILLQVKNALDEGAGEVALQEMMKEFYQVIRHKTEIDYEVSKKLLSRKQDLCQLIRDMLNISETNMACPNPSSLAKYRALRCKIEALDSTSFEFLSVEQQLLVNNYNDHSVRILQVYRVGRISETAEFLSSLGNVQSLFHASSVRNFMGILSRGLLMPKVVVEDHGLERTDIGNLGSGIYFSDSISASIKYSSPSEIDGTRLLAVCDVALGSCLDLCERDYSLNNAPSGYDSVHGVRKTADIPSDFEDDEFVVYKTCQVKIRYIVKFCLAEDEIKPFQPVAEVELEQDNNEPKSQCCLQHESFALPDANLSNHVKNGLQDRLGNPVPLEGVYIKGRIIDFVAQVSGDIYFSGTDKCYSFIFKTRTEVPVWVVMFQTYTNQNSKPIEAKYVFPLDDKAAVCGFEAFIDGKHVIGEVKEKKQAHREYRKAISQGDGAYLMDQDAPDVFVISVGNLPPNSTVVIKITYITELSFQHGSITFHLPASLSPWQQDKALNENTQDTIKKACVKEVKTLKNGFSVDMSIEMPSAIERIYSWTHKLKIKKTECKAVIKTVENSSLDISGFVVDIWISQVYLPRMWVEKHPDKMSEACMLVFQPEFDTAFEEEYLSSEIVILLDCSNSMAGSALHQAKQIALRVLELFCYKQRVNVIKFGTNFTELSSFSMNIISDLASLKEFIMSATATLGNTDLWKTLRYLSLLFPSQGHRNLVLISDGHIQNESVTFQIVKSNVQHTRLFTCGVGSTANRHMLRSLSHYGAGAFEYFDPKSKYNWEAKIRSQASRISSPECSSVSIKWQQFNTGAPEPMQAPAQIQSLFNNERLLVYGFVPHCTQATLKAVINDQELQTVVSTTELQKTTGTVLHKLAARAFISDYEDGILHENETKHEMKKQILKNMVIDLSLENSVISQFTSFVAIEKRDANKTCSADAPNILEIIAQEDVDFLPYIDWDGKSIQSDGFYSRKAAYGTMACFAQAGLLYSTYSLLEEDEPENKTFQSKEVPVNLNSLSPKPMAQSFVNVSELDSTTCSLQSNFSFDRDITEERSSGERSPSPCGLHLPRLAKPFSPFPLMSNLGGGISLTQQKSLQTPAFTKSDVSVDVPKPALPPPLPCSFQKPMGALKHDFHSFGAPVQAPGLFCSSAFICTNSEKTNIENQVIPKFPDFQANRKKGLSNLKCKKKAVRQHNAVTLEEGFTEKFNIVKQHKIKANKWVITFPESNFTVDLPSVRENRELSRCFKTTEEERIQQRIELMSVNWKEVFALQNQDGSWNLSPELGKILKFDVDNFINNFLIRKGIQSLGPNGKAKLLQLIATLLVLQFIRCTKQLKGIVFRTLMKLDDSSISSDVHWALELIKKATEWARRAERQFPSICYRLELGKDWDSATKKILGINSPNINSLST